MARSIAVLGVRVEGIELVQAALNALPRAVQKKIERRVLGAGATVIKRVATSLVPVKEKRLKAAIAVKRKTYRKSGNVIAIVGYREGKDDKKGAPHAHLVEFGTVERFHKSGKSTGTMPEFGFMRRAIRDSGPAVAKAMQDRMRVAVDEAVLGIRSKYARRR